MRYRTGFDESQQERKKKEDTAIFLMYLKNTYQKKTRLVDERRKKLES